MINRNTRWRLLLIFGLALIALAGFLYLLQSIGWYFAFVVGLPLVLAKLNHSRDAQSLPNHILHQPNSFFAIYLTFAGSGLAVELFRILTDLWEYAYPLNSPLAVILWITIVYPLFFWGILESYLFFEEVTGKSSIGALLALLFLIAWNDLPNLSLPVWVVNTPQPPTMPILFTAGYILEVIVAVTVKEVVITRSKSPPDTS